MTNDIPEDMMRTFYDKVVEICEFVVKVEGNTAAFPEDFLMLYRWGKGRKDQVKTPQGYVVKHLEVGGRTSSYIPELQKKVGSGTAKRKSANDSGGAKKQKVKSESEDEGSEEAPKPTTTTRSGRASRKPKN
jgi:formamidopyrimidine-DNA glycosylase